MSKTKLSTSIIWANNRYYGTLAEPIDEITERLHAIDPDCYRVTKMVSSEKEDVYEVQVFLGNRLGIETLKERVA